MNSGLVREFEKLLGPSSVLYRPEDLLLYEYDGSVEQGRPNLVVFPASTEDVSRIAKLAAKYNLPIVARGAGPGLSRRALAPTGGPLPVLPRLTHLLELAIETHRVTALQLVLPDGEIVRVGGRHGDTPCYDLAGLFVGSEGTLALVTEITVKLSRKPEAVKTLLAIFDSVDDAADTVVDITARAITPPPCEMLDAWPLRPVDAYIHPAFPIDLS